MASHEEQQGRPRPEIRRLRVARVKPVVKPKRPAPKPAPSPIFTDWAMI